MLLHTDNPIKGELFGRIVHPNKAYVVLIPMPWEVTRSGDAGTARAPEHILATSYQVNGFHNQYEKADQLAITMLPAPYELEIIGQQLHQKTQTYISALEAGIAKPTLRHKTIKFIDQQTAKAHQHIKQKALRYLEKGKVVGLVGGEHSSALGLMEAMGSHYGAFGILQIDAQPNLHQAFQGFQYSYASTMYNALQYQEVTKLVQLGLRDCAPVEVEMIASQPERIVSFFDDDIKRTLLQGESWHAICKKIVAVLPAHTYLSVDISGLDPKLCPHTSNPVPGGLEMGQIVYLLEQIVAANKKIIGFDLCEVGSDETSDWDVLVASRLLYQFSIYAAASQGKLSPKA